MKWCWALPPKGFGFREALGSEKGVLSSEKLSRPNPVESPGSGAGVLGPERSCLDSDDTIYVVCIDTHGIGQSIPLQEARG
mmetsp:Transcript_9339/g.17909  ORF Transcript_9339/g.17909 Transcript_9339/m.17909 type:complete len:81 (+) Transcript_9339:2014-2256(+)